MNIVFLGTVTQLKNAKRAGPPPPFLMPAGDPQIRALIDAVLTEWPSFDCRQMFYNP